jgi:two-component system sensor histidine kinase AlgZ
MPQPNVSGGSDSHRSFLPNFCDARVVFLMVIVAELIAVILGLAPVEPKPDRWTYLSLLSLFILWITLSSAVVLCLLRRLMTEMNPVGTTVISLGVVLTITALCSQAALWLDRNTLAQLLAPSDTGRAFHVRNLAISGIITLLALRYFYMQRAWKTKLRAEADARIQALQARIRPHFLFNSMNTIASLVHTDPNGAERAIEDLSELFRASLAGRTRIRLQDELDLTRRYLELEHMRLGERLHVDWDVDSECSEAIMPALVLQPLVENAIYHGIQTISEGGTIEVKARCDGKTLKLLVSNPLSKESLASVDTSGNHMAQANIRERLELGYGAAGHLDVDTYTGRYNVTVTLPFEEQSDAIVNHR